MQHGSAVAPVLLLVRHCGVICDFLTFGWSPGMSTYSLPSGPFRSEFLVTLWRKVVACVRSFVGSMHSHPPLDDFDVDKIDDVLEVFSRQLRHSLYFFTHATTKKRLDVFASDEHKSTRRRDYAVFQVVIYIQSERPAGAEKQKNKAPQTAPEARGKARPGANRSGLPRLPRFKAAASTC